MADEKNTNEQEKTQFTVIGVEVDDAVVKITGYNDETDEGGDLSIAYKKYDSEAHEFTDDEEALDAAEKNLTEMFGISLEDVIAAGDGATDLLEGKTFEGYYNDENARIYLNPRNGFTRFEKLTNAAVKAIKALDMPVTTSKVEESHNHGINKSGSAYAIYRFELGIPCVIDGEEKLFRISQLAFPSSDPDEDDTVLSLSYATKDVKDKFAKVDKNEFKSPAVQAKMLKVAEKMLEAQRAKLVGQITNLLGRDFDELIESGEGLPISEIEVAKAGGFKTADGQVAKYIIATVDTSAIGDADVPF